MFSAKVVVFAFLAICGAVIVSADFTLDTEKCKATAEKKEFLKDCYKSVVGKDFDAATFQLSDITAEQKLDIGLCAAKKSGSVSEDGLTFNLAKAVANVDVTVTADDATKAALKEAITNCDNQGGPLPVVLKCGKDAIKQICGGH